MGTQYLGVFTRDDVGNDAFIQVRRMDPRDGILDSMTMGVSFTIV